MGVKRPDGLPNAVTTEACYLAAMLDELRGIRDELRVMRADRKREPPKVTLEATKLSEPKVVAKKKRKPKAKAKG